MSPDSTSLYSSNTVDQISKEDFFAERRWEEIIRFKNDFIQDKIEEPLDCPYMRSEIAESWVRSRDYGVSPYVPGQTLAKKVDPETFREILNRNHLLIDITLSQVYAFRDLFLFSSYSLILIEKNGIILLDKWSKAPSSEQESQVGYMMSEEAVGTNAHILCMKLKRPVQLLGPEHYSVASYNIVASAAPIMDDQGDVMAVLGLVLPIKGTSPWENNFLGFLSYSSSLLVTLAKSIEARIILEKRFVDLKTVSSKLRITNEALLAVEDEAIITIDQTGKIIHLNRQGARILKLKDYKTAGANIKSFLHKQSSLMTLVATGEKTDIKQTLYTENEENTYSVSIRPIMNQETQQFDTTVLRLKPANFNGQNLGRAGSTAVFDFDEILGESQEIKDAIKRAQLFAGSEENILLIGESGTGKELFAQAIHNASSPHGPFMAVNCAAMPRELIESELFGYEGGSFTGADRSGRPGKIELANGGTLFLDEIGDMPLELQAVLLRTLEDKQIMRIGGRRYKKVDFRLVAATNKDLNQMVGENRFREDLYFRLSVLPINIPSLRQRKNDIDVLSRYFIENYCRKQGRKQLQLSPAAHKRINEYSWPGNVRELKNAIIYAVNTTVENVIEMDNLPVAILSAKNTPYTEGLKARETMSLKNLEKTAIEKAMISAGNQVSLAADILEISRATLYRKLIEYKIATE